jgi:signal transduction histidine kinase
VSGLKSTILIAGKTIGLWPFVILVYLLSISNTGFAESSGDTQIDSLRALVNENTGADKISSQLDLAFQIRSENADEAQSLANAALNAAQKIGDKKLQMLAYHVLGRLYQEEDKKELSLAYLDTALSFAEVLDDNWYRGEIQYRIGANKHHLGKEIDALEAFNATVKFCRLSDNFKTLGSAYSMMGSIFRMNGLYDRAIEYTIKSKLNYEKAGFEEGSAWIAYLLGRIYADLKLPENALEYFTEALEVYLKLAAIDGNQNGLVICYEQIGMLHLEWGNFDEARKNIEKSLIIHTANKSKYGISNVHRNLGRLEYSIGNYDEAEKYLMLALQAKEEIGDLHTLPFTYEYLGLSLIKQGQVKQGLDRIKQGLDLAISNNQKEIQLNIYAKLAEVYLSLNDLENAIACQNKQIEIQNLILLGDVDAKTEQLQAIYEIDDKNNQIIQLEKQNEINALSIKQHKSTRNLMILGIVMALLLAITIYWFYMRIRDKNRELHETNASKDKFFAIIAHDLRGPTGALTSLLEHLNSNFDEFSVKEFKDILSTLHKSAENVSNLLENLLIWAQSQIRKIEYRPNEIKLSELLYYSADGIKQFAENKQITIDFELDDQLLVLADRDMVQTIVRNLLVNSIKFSKRGTSIIVKSLAKNTNTALVSIADSGVGIEKSKLKTIFDISNTHHTKGTENEQSTGLGLILVKDFIEKNNGTISIESQKDKGTTVSFTLPRL